MGELFGGEPEVGDIGGAQAKDVFQGAADFFEAEVDAQVLEQVDERSCAFSQHRRRKLAEGVRSAIERVIGDDIHRAVTRAVAHDVKKAPGTGLLWWEPNFHRRTG